MSATDNMRAALAPLRDQLAEALAPVIAQVRANRRLAIALALIPIIVWGYLILSTQAWVDDEVQRLVRTREEVARLEKVATDAAWSRRAREADARRIELEGRMWRIETEGLARAEFQEWLLGTSRKAGIGRPQVRLDANDTEAQRQSGYRALNASLSGDFSPESLQAFLAAIANEKRLIVINSMRIQRQPLPRIDMVLTAYGLPASALPAAPAAAAPGAAPAPAAAAIPAGAAPAMQAPAMPAAPATPFAPPPSGGAAAPPPSVGLPPDIAARLLNAPAAPPAPPAGQPR